MPQQKTLLIVSGGIEAADAALRAKEMGLYVVVSDYNPEAPGFAHADSCLIADVYGPSETAAAAERYNRKIRRIDGVICVAADAPLTTATVAERLHLPGISRASAELACDKLAMKRRFAETGVPIPWFSEVETPQALQRIAVERGRDLVIKPADSRGSRGVQRVHLKDLSLAAAGLAHETRNPLNIIRGLAQIIAKQDGIPPEISAKSREIINETDRVTAQLNEFINYSRPREVRRAATDLGAVASEVARALNYDIEEKKIRLEVLVEPVVIEADEQLLRQALFNLALNAIQAVPPEGVIRIRASRRSNEEAFIEISDNGPGVPPEHRGEIFKPYFTTHPEGTGLGLSVVQQIILAHGWEIQCLPNESGGALFRISHVKLKIKE